MDATEPAYIIYTDGGCAYNPGGPGGCAAVLINTDTGEISEYSAGYKATTNNRMEIMAVILALKHIDHGPVQLYSDSQYVVNTLCGAYSKSSNMDLWVELEWLRASIPVFPKWVRGHSGNFYNERCDELCTAAMQDTEHLLYDNGYYDLKAGCNQQKQQEEGKMIKGSMGINIQVPDCFTEEKIEELDVSSYAEKYHVTPRCAKCILRFNQEKIPKFADYKNLQVGGLDHWSYDNLKKHIEQMEHRNEFVETVSKYIDNDTDKKSCMRWYLRGLPLKHAIRKVLVDAEINKNCKK